MVGNVVFEDYNSKCELLITSNFSFHRKKNEWVGLLLMRCIFYFCRYVNENN